MTDAVEAARDAFMLPMMRLITSRLLLRELPKRELRWVAAIRADEREKMADPSYRCEQMCDRGNYGGACRCSELNEAQPESALRAALEGALQLLEYGNFKNGVTDPTGSIDEGEVRAGRIYDEIRAALDGAP